MRMLRAPGEVHLVPAVEVQDRARAAQLLDMQMVATVAAEAEVTPKTRAGQLPRGMLIAVMEVPAAALRRLLAPQATPEKLQFITTKLTSLLHSAGRLV